LIGVVRDFDELKNNTALSKLFSEKESTTSEQGHETNARSRAELTL